MAARAGRKTCELLRQLTSLSLNSSRQRHCSSYQVQTWLRTVHRSAAVQQKPPLEQRFQGCPQLCAPVTRGLTTASGELGEHVKEEDELDDLYRQIDVEVKGHDPAVLNSYQKFVALAAQELDIDIAKIFTPPKVITRRTLLKSVHIFKKHRVQYEWRTHFRVFEFKHLTGSTADTFLEYIQRNLPEGVAMKVTRHRLEEFPAHLTEAIKESRGKPKDHEPPLS